MQPAVSYILYATSYHKQTGNIISFAKFEEGNLVENKRNVAEDDFFEPSPGYSFLYQISEGDTSKTTIYDQEMSYGQTVKPS